MAVLDSYVRVSKQGDREGESFISPVEQREAIERWATQRGFSIGRRFEEINESGGRADRPKLLEAIERVERGESEGIIVAHLDRFFRSQLHGLLAVDRIRRAGGFFVSADGDIDTRDDKGDLLLGIRLSIAQDERRRRRENFAQGRRRAVDRGIHPSPVPPFGYTRPHDDSGRILGPLEPHPQWAEVVGEIFVRAARMDSWVAVGRWLESLGAKTAYGSAVWPARAVKDLVRNRVYLGEARHGEFVNRHAHPPLTDDLTFARAQRTGVRFPPARSETPALLSGLIRCAGCRYGMQSWYARDGRQYRCRRRYAAGECPAPAYVAGAVIEPYVIDLFLKTMGNVRSIDPGGTPAEVQAAEDNLRMAERALVKFRDDPVLLDQLSPRDYAAGVNVRRQAYEDAQNAYVSTMDRLAPMASTIPENLHDAWPRLATDEQRELLSAGLDAIFVRAGRSRHDDVAGFTDVCFAGEAPPDLPRRGIKVIEPIRSYEPGAGRRMGLADSA